MQLHGTYQIRGIRYFSKGIFPSNNFPSGKFPNVQFPKQQLPKCAISQEATSKMCNFPSGNFPKVRCNGPVRHRMLPWGRALWIEWSSGQSAAARTYWGWGRAMRLGQLPLGKIPNGKLPFGKNSLGKYLTSN